MDSTLKISNNGKVIPVSIAGFKYLLSVEEAIEEELEVKCVFLENTKYRKQLLFLVDEDIYRLSKRDVYAHTQWLELKKLTIEQINKIKIDEDNKFIINIIMKKRGAKIG